MKAPAVFLFLISFSFSSFGAVYSCAVSGLPDYRVEVNLKSGKAAFWDNDGWTVVRQNSLNTSSGLFSFHGRDSFGDFLAISFDTSETANLTGHYGEVKFASSTGQVRKGLRNCRSKSNLNSGI